MELNREHLRAIIYYNYKKKMTRQECLTDMVNVLGDKSVSKSTVEYWYREFTRNRKSIEDDPRSGRPVTATDDETVDIVRKMVIEYRKVTYEEIRERLNIGASAVYTILHDRLGLRKVLSRWVPHKLSDEQKQQRLEIYRKNLKWLSESGSQVISKIITGDETYVYFYEAPTRHESRVWVFEDEPTPQQAKTSRSVRRIMYAVFFRSTGLIKAIKLEGQKTVTAKWYSEVCLPQVFDGLKIRRIVLHHDNAPAHTASVTKEFLAEKISN